MTNHRGFGILPYSVSPALFLAFYLVIGEGILRFINIYTLLTYYLVYYTFMKDDFISVITILGFVATVTVVVFLVGFLLLGLLARL